MTQGKRPEKTKRNTPSVNGTKSRTKKLTAEFGPKPNFMTWKAYHSLAFHDPEKLKKAISRSSELKAEREGKKVFDQWPLGPKPDHIGTATYHSMAHKAPWELSELCLKMYSGPAALAPEQRVFKPTRGLTQEEKRRVANAYGILRSGGENAMEKYLKRLEQIEPSLVGK